MWFANGLTPKSPCDGFVSSPGTRIDEHLADPTTNAVDTLANNADRIQLIRERLSNPSWFMKQAKQVPGTCLDRAVVIC